jgi:hypothetical protein
VIWCRCSSGKLLHQALHSNSTNSSFLIKILPQKLLLSNVWLQPTTNASRLKLAPSHAREVQTTAQLMGLRCNPRQARATTTHGLDEGHCELDRIKPHHLELQLTLKHTQNKIELDGEF